MNYSILEGRITRDPEVKTLPTGSTVVSFTLAVNRGDKNKTTDFIPCVAWGTKADFIGRYFTKGKGMQVFGKLTMRSYEKDGQTVTRFEVLVNDVQFPLTSNVSSDASGRNTGDPDANDDVFEF